MRDYKNSLHTHGTLTLVTALQNDLVDKLSTAHAGERPARSATRDIVIQGDWSADTRHVGLADENRLKAISDPQPTLRRWSEAAPCKRLDH